MKIRTLLSLSLAIVALGGCAPTLMVHGVAVSPQQVTDHVYAQPLEAVFPQARQLLFENGFEAKTVQSWSIETEWKEGTPTGNFHQSTRYLVVGTPVDAGHCRVQITEQTQGWFDNVSAPPSQSASRDLALEAQLISRVEPSTGVATGSGSTTH